MYFISVWGYKNCQFTFFLCHRDTVYCCNDVLIYRISRIWFHLLHTTGKFYFLKDWVYSNILTIFIINGFFHLQTSLNVFYLILYQRPVLIRRFFSSWQRHRINWKRLKFLFIDIFNDFLIVPNRLLHLSQ